VILFVDSSSIVSLHLQETGRAGLVGHLIAAADAVSCSRIAYVEVRRALARARQERPRRLSAGRYTQAVSQFNSDWPRYVRVAVTERLIHAAGDVAERHVLKALDALQLASAIALKNGVPDMLVFSSWDGNLNKAARTEGLVIAEEHLT